MSFKQETKHERKDKEFSSAHQRFEYWIKNPESHTENLFNKEEDFILTDQEKMVAGDIIREYKKSLEDFKGFLNKEYLHFEYKINRCSYTHCYADIFRNRQDISTCLQKCHSGVDKANYFVGQKLDEFNLELNTCLEKSQKQTKDIMNESFKCFDDMLKRFITLKRTVKTEFDYYQ